MQFKYIILSAAALAMVSAAPIENPHTDAADTATTAAAPGAPKELTLANCAATTSNESEFADACKICYERATEHISHGAEPSPSFEGLTPAEQEEVSEFFKTCLPKAPEAKKPVTARAEDAPNVPAAVDASQSAPKADAVEPPKVGGIKTPAVGAPAVGAPAVGAPAVDTAGTSA